MKLYAFSTLLLVALTSGLAGCAADATDEDAAESDQEVVSRFHYDPIEPSVFWKPGCGVAPPDGSHCEMGLFVKFTRQYIDLKVDTKVTVNDRAKTITVKLDTWSKTDTHPLTLVALMPQTQRLDTTGTRMGVEYGVRVVNWKNVELWNGTVTMMPAP